MKYFSKLAASGSQVLQFFNGRARGRAAEEDYVDSMSGHTMESQSPSGVLAGSQHKAQIHNVTPGLRLCNPRRCRVCKKRGAVPPGMTATSKYRTPPCTHTLRPSSLIYTYIYHLRKTINKSSI